MSDSRLRIVLAEDDVLLREGLAELLGRFGHRVVATVGDAEGLIAAVESARPDVVVTDVRMPPDFGDEGIRAAVELRRRYMDLGVLVLSQYVAPAYAVDLLEGGGSEAGLGYLLKDRVGAVVEFIDAVERIAGGGTVIDPQVVRRLLERKREDQPLERLTAREREVLGEMAEGKTNAGIAAALDVSQAAVAKHIGAIFTKLGLGEADGHRRVLAVLTHLRV
nr:LuxR family DNA-binding response regulator [uncultured bacterium]